MPRDSVGPTAAREVLAVTVLSPVAASAEQLTRMLSDCGMPFTLRTVTGGVERAGFVVEQALPQVLIVESARHSESDLLALEMILGRYPGLAIVLLSSNQSVEFLRLGMRIGLREILPLPVSRDALIEAIGRIAGRDAARPQRKARVISFVGCKGGSGATFLAANFAYALAGLSKVALVDLNIQFGDASLYISERLPATNLSDVARQIDHLDASFLQSSMLHVLPNLHVLAAPEDPEQALAVRPEHIDLILWTAAAHYDFVVVDAGRALDALSLRAMDASDTVYAVIQLSLPFVRDGKRLLRALAGLGYGKDKVKLLVNRLDRRSALTPEQVSSALKHEVARSIPNSFGPVSDSVNQGIPILKMSARDPVSRALAEMAGELIPAKADSPGWLKALVGRRA